MNSKQKRHLLGILEEARSSRRSGPIRTAQEFLSSLPADDDKPVDANSATSIKESIFGQFDPAGAPGLSKRVSGWLEEGPSIVESYYYGTDSDEEDEDDE